MARRYHANAELERARSRDYYARNRDAILAKSQAKRDARRDGPRTCSDCGTELEARKRVTCGTRRCREARYKRTNPESYAKREAAKVARRREARRAQREHAADEGDW